MPTNKKPDPRAPNKRAKTAGIAGDDSKLQASRKKKRAANAALKRTAKPAAKKTTSKKKAPAKKTAAKKTAAKPKPKPKAKPAAKKPAAKITAANRAASAKRVEKKVAAAVDAVCPDCGTAAGKKDIGTVCDSCKRGVVEFPKLQAVPKSVATVTPIGKPKKPAAPTKADELGEVVPVTLPWKFLSAALSVAPKDDTRYMLNGVHLVQNADKSLRIVCTDGHRLFVASQLLEEKIGWLSSGVTLPRDHLDRVLKYLGRKTEAVQIESGDNHAHLVVREVDGIATFKFKPVDGKFPEFQRVIDSAAGLFSEERESMSITSLDAAYVKSAGVLSATLGATGVLPFLSSDGKTASVFAFNDVPEALLYIMPQKAREEVLPAATTKLFGKAAMTETLKTLEAQIKKTRTNARTAKHKKFKDQFAAKADRLQNRADQLRAALSTKLAAPKPVAEEKPAPTKPTVVESKDGSTTVVH